MRESTRKRYWRIQYFYRRLSKAKLKHDYCLDIIKEFFNMSDPLSISRIISEDLGECKEYEHRDLDDIWIDGVIQKTLSGHVSDLTKWMDDKISKRLDKYISEIINQD